MKVTRKEVHKFEDMFRAEYPNELNDFLQHLYLGDTYIVNTSVPNSFDTQIKTHFNIIEDTLITLSEEENTTYTNVVEISEDLLEKLGLNFIENITEIIPLATGLITTVKNLEDLEQKFKEIDNEIKQNNYTDKETMFREMAYDLKLSKTTMRTIKNKLEGMIEDEINFMELRIENLPKNILIRVQSWLKDKEVIENHYKINCTVDYCNNFSTKEYDSKVKRKLYTFLNYSCNFVSYYDILYKDGNINMEEEIKSLSDIIIPCLDCNHKIDLEFLVNQYKENEGYLFDIRYFKFKPFKGE